MADQFVEARGNFGLDERLFESLTTAIRTLRRCFENVIRHTGIWAGNAIVAVIERNLVVAWIALAGVYQSLGFAKGYGIDERNDLGDAVRLPGRLTSRAGILTTPAVRAAK
jgi:hypothetical protein